MRRKYLLLIPMLLLVGCTNKLEEEKSDYLTYKSELLTTKNFAKEEELECVIDFDLQRVSGEKIEYIVTISNPKIDMYDIKALLIHDHFTEEIFPSVGIFDNTVNLLTSDEENLKLSGTIQTEKDIIDTDFRLYLEYIDKDNLKNYIYYKMTK